MKDRKKFLLLDGHSLAYRAFFALPDSMTTAGGRPTNAVYGFTSMLFKAIEEERPDAVVVAFDGPRKDLLRMKEFPEYKAHRPAMPDELRTQMDMIDQLLECMNIPRVTAEGHEADDVLGTMAREISSKGDLAVIVTGDRDTLQLAGEGTDVLLTGKGITETLRFDADAVREKYGLPPVKMPDMIGLKGDKSDNIPGVPGIGEKGAAALIKEYGSLERLYDHIDEIPGKKGEALKENRDVAFLSRHLARLQLSVPLVLDYESIMFGDWEKHAVLDYLGSLDFKTLSRRFTELFAEAGEKAEAGGSDIPYTLVDASKPSDVELFAKDARETGTVGIAAQVAGEGYCEVELESLGLATADRVLSVRLDQGGTAVEMVKEILSSGEVLKVFHDAKTQCEALDKSGIPLRNIAFDTMVAAYLENPSLGNYRLLDIWERNAAGAISIDGEVEEYASQGTLLTEGDEELKELAYEAARVLNLRGVLSAKLSDLGMSELMRDVELPLVSVLKEMEETGVAIDVSVVGELEKEAAGHMRELEAEIHRLARRDFKISSTKQLAQVLFEEMGIAPIKKTKTGYSTDSSVLESLKGEWEIAGKVLEYREFSKLKSTYLDVLPRLVCPRTGLVHCSFNQTATATGRLSSSNPNMQNIPVRTEVGRKIRSAFVPRQKGWKMLVADYSQIELRVLAHMSGDAELIGAFAKDRDIHRETASSIFGVLSEEVTPEMRRMAKVVNFGIVYGMGYYGLSSRLQIPMEEATRFIDTYFDRYPDVLEYRKKCIADATGKGYAETILGRRRYIPELASGNRQTREAGERLAINTPLQGTAADIVKKAMVEVQGRLGGTGMESRMTLQVHDSLNFDAPPDEVARLTDLVREAMSGVFDLKVELKVDIGVYENWGEAG